MRSIMSFTLTSLLKYPKKYPVVHIAIDKAKKLNIAAVLSGLFFQAIIAIAKDRMAAKKYRKEIEVNCH